MEHWESLCAEGFQMVWSDELFRPSTDSFLLASLPQLKRGLRVMDLGCGCGLLGLLLLQRERELSVTGLELDPNAAALGQRCGEENGIQDRFLIQQGDIRAVRSLFPTGAFDLVICNPPYYEPLRGKTAQASALRAARAETDCTLDDICAAASYLLRWGGRLCLVHKPERLTDVLLSFRAHAIEPKRLRFVCSKVDSAPSLFLIEGCRGGKNGLKLLPPLILMTSNGAPTAEVDAIYFRARKKEETL